MNATHQPRAAEERNAELISLPLATPRGKRELRLLVLGAFGFADGNSMIVLPGSSQRLLGFLALQNRTVTRTATAGALWPDSTEEHAHASLRSALSRLSSITRRAIHVSPDTLVLKAGVRVDIRDARALANRLLVVGGAPAAEDTTAAAVIALSSELLPDCYEDWAMLEAEDWRNLRLHALDALARNLVENGRFAEATTAALAAVSAEPLRETGNATLIHIHLAEGNLSEAIAAFERYRAVLQEELGLDPSPLLNELMLGIHADAHPAGA
ncbi:MAG: BTAD domain-containing putative transcriptional regulator [Vicinamibacteria bacterium]